MTVTSFFAVAVVVAILHNTTFLLTLLGLLPNGNHFWPTRSTVTLVYVFLLFVCLVCLSFCLFVCLVYVFTGEYACFLAHTLCSNLHSNTALIRSLTGVGTERGRVLSPSPDCREAQVKQFSS